MLKGGCIHPGITAAAALCGHGDQILIADGNYPLGSRSGEAEKIFLGLRQNLPTVQEVLRTLLTLVEVESAQVMATDERCMPEAALAYAPLLKNAEMTMLPREAFYEACCGRQVRLAISTGDVRPYANILLTVGAV